MSSTYVSDSDSDSDNPYDFRMKFQKILQESALSKIKSIINEHINNKESSSSSSSSSTSCVITDTDTGTSISEPLADIQNGLVQPKKKRKFTAPESAKVIGPVICIGDFDDGYDMPLPKLPVPKDGDDEFTLETKIEVDMNEDFPELVNRVINVKVYWCKEKAFRFPIRMYQSIESIYEYFAKLENIDKSEVSLELDKKLLSPSDTPNSINYKVVDFIDGEIVFYRTIEERSKIVRFEPVDEVNFCIKQKDMKHPMTMSIKKTDKMLILYIKLSEKLGLDISSFTLEFDGDKIKYSDTMESLELDGDECFELYKKNIE